MKPQSRKSVLLLILGLAAAACTQAPAPATPTAEATAESPPSTLLERAGTVQPLGEVQADGDLYLLPTKVEQLTRSGSDQPRAGDVYLVVTLSLKNINRTAIVHFEPAQLRLKDSVSSALIAPVSLRSLDNLLQAQDIQPLTVIDGVLVYEVPPADIQKSLLDFQRTDGPDLLWTLAN
jgi:uncharacterized protein DUF4352